MPKSHTRKLNDTQLVILSSASQREDGFAVLPEGVRAASVKAAVIRLTKLGFLKQVRVKRDQPHWLTDEQGRRIGLKITNAGSVAMGVWRLSPHSPKASRLAHQREEGAARRRIRLTCMSANRRRRRPRAPCAHHDRLGRSAPVMELLLPLNSRTGPLGLI